MCTGERKFSLSGQQQKTLLKLCDQIEAFVQQRPTDRPILPDAEYRKLCMRLRNRLRAVEEQASSSRIQKIDGESGALSHNVRNTMQRIIDLYSNIEAAFLSMPVLLDHITIIKSVLSESVARIIDSLQAKNNEEIEYIEVSERLKKVKQEYDILRSSPLLQEIAMSKEALRLATDNASQVGHLIKRFLREGIKEVTSKPQMLDSVQFLQPLASMTDADFLDALSAARLGDKESKYRDSLEKLQVLAKLKLQDGSHLSVSAAETLSSFETIDLAVFWESLQSWRERSDDLGNVFHMFRCCICVSHPEELAQTGI